MTYGTYLANEEVQVADNKLYQDSADIMSCQSHVVQFSVVFDKYRKNYICVWMHFTISDTSTVNIHELVKFLWLWR